MSSAKSDGAAPRAVPIGISFAAIVTLAILALHFLGRRAWCRCGALDLSSWDVWSRHNSQHLVDPYFFSHVIHGLIFYWLFRWAIGERRLVASFTLAMALEAGWEVFENTAFVIDRYREETASLDYVGDSIANSVTDIFGCAMGYGLAAAIPLIGSALLFFLIETIMLIAIRDGFLLNVLMLIRPVEGIKKWQLGG